MDPAVVEVEAERLRVAFPKGERAAASAGSVNRSSSVRCSAPWVCVDVAQDAAGADGGELLIVSDQPDTRTAIDGELARWCRGRGCRPCRPRR